MSKLSIQVTEEIPDFKLWLSTNIFPHCVPMSTYKHTEMHENVHIYTEHTHSKLGRIKTVHSQYICYIQYFGK